MDSGTARASFELANAVKSVPCVDSIFHYNHAEQQKLLSTKPWEKE